MNKYEKIVYGIIVAMAIALIIFINIDFTGHKMEFEEDVTNTFTYLRGGFKVDGNKEGRVYIYNDSKPYIQIITKDKLYVYNDKEGSETEKTYGKLISRYNIKSNSNVETPNS